MVLSACYIVKNEEKTLARSLASIQSDVDEIVVVDTGSVDATKAAAQSFGATVVDFAWQDDFAAARNQALELAKGDWVLFLDADEYVSASTRGKLRQIIESQPEKNVLLLTMRNIDSETGEELLTFSAPRLFRHKKSFRYAGRIHEQLLDAGQPIQQVAWIPGSELCLLHTGYSAQLAPVKAGRNLALLQRELRETDQPERWYMYLAETYDVLGEREKAMEYARLDIAGGRQQVTYASRSYRILLRCLAEPGEAVEERLSVARQAVRDFPELPEFWAELAEALAAAGDFQAASIAMETALQKRDSYAGQEPMCFSEAMCAMGRQRLAFWQGKMKTAARERLAGLTTQQRMERCILHVQQLTGCLLLTAKDPGRRRNFSQALSCLPDTIQHVLCVYRGEQRTLLEADYEGYEAIAPCAAVYLSGQALLDFAGIARQFPAAQVWRAADTFFRLKEWQAAGMLYQQLPVEIVHDTGRYWHFYGICCYHLQQWAEARRCLLQAETLQPGPDIQLYLQWCEKGQNHD